MARTHFLIVDYCKSILIVKTSKLFGLRFTISGFLHSIKKIDH